MFDDTRFKMATFMDVTIDKLAKTTKCSRHSLLCAPCNRLGVKQRFVYIKTKIPKTKKHVECMCVSLLSWLCGLVFLFALFLCFGFVHCLSVLFW